MFLSKLETWEQIDFLCDFLRNTTQKMTLRTPHSGAVRTSELAITGAQIRSSDIRRSDVLRSEILSSDVSNIVAHLGPFCATPKWHPRYWCFLTKTEDSRSKTRSQSPQFPFRGTLSLPYTLLGYSKNSYSCVLQLLVAVACCSCLLQLFVATSSCSATQYCIARQ